MRRRRLRRAGLLAALLVGAGAAGCASAGSDVHAAPFFTRLWTPEGARETEAAGGLWRSRRDGASGELQQLTVGPLFGYDPLAPEAWRAHYLVPLGYASQRGEQARAWLFPLWLWDRRVTLEGERAWQLVALPGLILLGREDERTQVALFPLYGNLEDVAIFDRLVFVLFPLFAHAVRDGRVSYSFLWPILAWRRGEDERSFRFFPFYGRTRRQGRYDRLFLLWPFFHFQRNFLGGEGEEPEVTWMLFPLVGHKERGSYRAWTWLWPLFGWARDPRSGFWALDSPWPFVRLQRGGADDVHRTRIWPFYSYLRADRLEAWTYLWPVVHVRRERYPRSARESLYVVPFWQSSRRVDAESGEELLWRKLFPLFQYERDGERRRGSFPTLDPFWRNEVVDRFYAWLWKLWEFEEDARVRSERSWLGLWRRERGAREDRRSLSGLWSSRRYLRGTERRRETSLLFGLVRWRVTEGEGFAMLRPAFPGPGWPRFAEPAAAPAPGVAPTDP